MQYTLIQEYVHCQQFMRRVFCAGKRLSQYTKNGLWVGADDIAAEGNFTWTDGTVIPRKSNLWSYGQPDDYGRYEDCVQVRYLRDFVLTDESCSQTVEFVCQVDVKA